MYNKIKYKWKYPPSHLIESRASFLVVVNSNNVVDIAVVHYEGTNRQGTYAPQIYFPHTLPDRVGGLEGKMGVRNNARKLWRNKSKCFEINDKSLASCRVLSHQYTDCVQVKRNNFPL